VRLEPPQKAYVRALDHIRKALNADDKDDLRSIALRTIEEAGAKIESPSPSTLKLLEQAKNDLKDKKLSEAQLDTLSLLESGAWIEAQALRSKKLSDLIDGSINGIAEAQKKNCVCAF
jgi:rRNA maturation endonuclease Nob1